ncbi:helix-turn-helix domain-containing protein [Pigmentiphaga sp. YJ18]|uniref:helix-turn-helix domain-containing protein n=2 Tax=Pigmentiphaga sp. YJ18 TaxID=3134907 RepID=UPI00310DDA6E
MGILIKNPFDREDFMKITLADATSLGPIVRAVRKAQGIRQDDAAGSVGVSENFLSKIERGGETAQWGKLFQVLDGLGIRIILDLPEDTAGRLPASFGSDAQRP